MHTRALKLEKIEERTATGKGCPNDLRRILEVSAALAASCFFSWVMGGSGSQAVFVIMWYAKFTYILSTCVTFHNKVLVRIMQRWEKTT